MSKLLTMLTAGALALTLGGFAAAADPTRPTEEPAPRASENQPADPGVVKTGPEQANQDPEYVAALKKCDSLNGGEKQKCVESAKKNFSRM